MHLVTFECYERIEDQPTFGAPRHGWKTFTVTARTVEYDKPDLGIRYYGSDHRIWFGPVRNVEITPKA